MFCMLYLKLLNFRNPFAAALLGALLPAGCQQQPLQRAGPTPSLPLFIFSSFFFFFLTLLHAQIQTAQILFNTLKM